jgi:hypothetical protein
MVKADNLVVMEILKEIKMGKMEKMVKVMQKL